MSLRKAAICPPPVCAAGDTVAQAVQTMVQARCGAVVIMDGDDITGIFTERDVLTKIVAKDRDAREVKLSEVMTSPVSTILETARVEDALKTMLGNHFRHLALINEDGQAIGLLSVRRIFEYRVDDLNQTCSSLISYMGADGPGG